MHSITNIRDTGAYKVQMTFATLEEMEEALSSSVERLLDVFYKVRHWNIDEYCRTHRILIECYSVPPYVWTDEIIKKIGKEWGKVVYLDDITKNGKSISTAKMLIDTCVWEIIHVWVYLSTRGEGI